MKTYLACFDIQDDRTRRLVGKLLLRYGERVQYSVFEVAFRQPSELERLKQEAQALLEEGDDLRFYYLNSEARRFSHDVANRPLAQVPAAIIV